MNDRAPPSPAPVPPQRTVAPAPATAATEHLQHRTDVQDHPADALRWLLGGAGHPIQRKPVDAGYGDVVAAAGPSAPGAGQPLDSTTRPPLEAALNTPLDGVRTHTDAAADTAARMLGARAFALGEDVYFRAGEYDPGSTRGTELLAHEVAHTVQARSATSTPGAALTVSQPDDASEREADAFASAFAQRMDRPGDGGPDAVLPAVQPHPGMAMLRRAPDQPRDAKTQGEDAQLAHPPAYTRHIGPFGMDFVPADSSYIAGIDRELQVVAATVLSMVGASAYTVALARELKAAIAIPWLSEPIIGAAIAKEKASRFRFGPALTLRINDWLMAPPRNLKTTLTAENIEVLQGGIDADATWPNFRSHTGPHGQWLTSGVYKLLCVSHKTLLKNYAAAVAEDNKTHANGPALAAAREAMVAVLLPLIETLDAIRDDPRLVDHPAYRSLMMLPALGKDEPAGMIQPVSKTAAVDTSLAVELLYGFENEPDKSLIGQRGSEAARRQLLDNFATRRKLAKHSVGGDTVMQDAPSKATRPPWSSSLRTNPPLEPPFFDVPKGSSRPFQMQLGFDDVFEAFAGAQYKWELIHVPDDAIAKISETADNASATSEDIGWGATLGGRLRRDIEYGKADMVRAISGITYQLGQPGLGATDLVAAGAMLRLVGTVITTFIEMVFKRANEKTFPFSNTGLFIIRCRAMPRVDAERAVITRMPSVAWLPVWVRPAEQMSKLRVNLDRKLRAGSIERLAEIDQELADQPPPSATRVNELREEQRDIRTTLFGSTSAVLELEQKKLGEAKNKLAAGDPQRKAIEARISDIDEILKQHADRIGGAATDRSREGVFRIAQASFVSDNGQTMRLMLDAFEQPKRGTKLVYRVIDSTTKDSAHEDGVGDTREDAIANALRVILESDHGYGRGYATIAVPPSGSAPPGAGEIEKTIRIEKSQGALVMEAIENITLVMSIAAIAAAPFTGGASLALLVPIGVIGAIPSAYRLIDRASQGTLRLDMAAAMDIVNIVASAVGLGQLAAEGKAALRGVKLGAGWMMLGLGTDGLSYAVAGAAFIAEVQDAMNDPNLLPGQRMARIMTAVGNQLLQAGMAVGGHLAAKGAAMEKAAGGKDTARPTHPRMEEHLAKSFYEAGGPKARDVPVFHDKTGTVVKGESIHIEYQLDGYGLPTDVRVIAGPNAKPASLKIHGQRAAAMMKYQGFFGYCRHLIDRANAWVRGNKAEPPPGSRGWEARHELAKLPQEMTRIFKALDAGEMHPQDALTHLDYLERQMRAYEKAIDELEAGKGYVAAQAPVTAEAIKKGYPSVADHYYVAQADGSYALVQVADAKGPRMRIERENGKPVAKPDTTSTPLPEAHITPGHTAKAPTLKPPPAEVAAISPTLQAHATQALGGAVAIKPAGDPVKQVLVKPIKGGGYEIALPKGATDTAVADAIARHKQLAAQRPANLGDPYYMNENGTRVRWTGTEEAAYRGRPDAEPGYHWALVDGDLRYARSAPEEGSTQANKKREFDEATRSFKDASEQPKGEDKFSGQAKDVAFDMLGGNDPREELGRWVEQALKIPGVTREVLIQALPEPGTSTHRHVRHTMKDKFMGRIVKEVITDAKHLQTKYPEVYKGVDPSDAKAMAAAHRRASHAEMLEVTKNLGSADRGSIAEKWSQALDGSSASDTQVALNKQQLKDKGITISEDRKADRIDAVHGDAADPSKVTGNKITEVKNVRDYLDKGDREQINDLTRVLGKSIEVAGKPHKIDALVVQFPDPLGGAANAKYIAGQLENPPPGLRFEIFGYGGRSEVLSKSSFTQYGGEQGLVAHIKSFTAPPTPASPVK